MLGLQLFVNQLFTTSILKGHLLRCKRSCFTHQKVIFCTVKHDLLQRNRL